MEVYLDLLIIENIIMNYIILWVTGHFSREKSNFLKLLISSSVGAMYSAMIFFPKYDFVYTLYFKILFSLLLVVIAFQPQKFIELVRVTSIFYVVSFVFGGAAFAIFYFTDINAIVSNGTFYIANFPIKILIISSIISYFIIKYAWGAIQKNFIRDKTFIDICVSYENKSLNLISLIDTGNSLYDPLTNTPVIVVEFESIAQILPEELVEIFHSSSENDLSIISSVVSSSKLMSRFRLIPFSSLGKENGMLIGFKPDYIIVYEGKNTIRIENIIIGIYNKKFSKTNKYNALMHPELMNNF